jgi:hypothetical protein
LCALTSLQPSEESNPSAQWNTSPYGLPPQWNSRLAGAWKLGLQSHRTILQGRETDQWLSIMPSMLKNGTKLSSQEFHVALLLCCARTPGDLPSSLCDGCGVEFCVRHALKCKVGGLVIMLRHRAQRDQLKELCNLASKALAP